MPQNEVTTLPRAAGTMPVQHTTQFSPDQVELIKRTICKGATDAAANQRRPLERA